MQINIVLQTNLHSLRNRLLWLTDRFAKFMDGFTEMQTDFRNLNLSASEQILIRPADLSGS